MYGVTRKNLIRERKICRKESEHRNLKAVEFVDAAHLIQPALSIEMQLSGA